MFERLRAWMRGGDLPPGLRPDRALLVPRVRNLAYVDTLRRVERERDVVPVEPFVGELVVAYGFDRPTHYQMATLRDVASLGLSQEQLRPIAIANAVRIAGGGFHARRTGPFLEIVHPLATTTLLVANLWESWAEMLGGELVVGVPRNDVVVACRMDDTEAVGLMASIVADDCDGAPTSPDLLVRVDGAWELLEDTDD